MVLGNDILLDRLNQRQAKYPHQSLEHPQSQPKNRLESRIITRCTSGCVSESTVHTTPGFSYQKKKKKKVNIPRPFLYSFDFFPRPARSSYSYKSSPPPHQPTSLLTQLAVRKLKLRINLLLPRRRRPCSSNSSPRLRGLDHDFDVRYRP